MQRRIVSSIVVAIVGLVPTLAGGPIFAALMMALGCGAYREFLTFAPSAPDSRQFPAPWVGYLAIAALALLGLTGSGAIPLFTVVMLAILAPLVLSLTRAPTKAVVAYWSIASAGALYLGLPAYSAVALRSLPGPLDAGWLTAWAEILSPGWEAAPKGLAWALVAILGTWVGDSAAFLTGRTFGSRRLAPAISPGKTIEGAIGGLAGTMLVGAIIFSVSGLGSWSIGVLAGAIIGAAGQLGDLCESLLKRQAGVKDSGTLIPGHGGLFDRIDALFFAFPAALVLATTFERAGLA